MILFLFFTALTCSIDCLLCAFSLLKKGVKSKCLFLGITVTVLFLCLIANYSTLLLNDNLKENSSLIGGIILVLVGIYNLVPKPQKNINSNSLIQSFAVGFAVGIDGAVANFSLSLMGLNSIYVPLTITLMHTLMICVAILLQKLTKIKKLALLDNLSPFLLIFLGSIKIAEFIL